MRAWIIWGVAMATYVVAVFHRGSLGVATVEAQHRFDATAAQLSLFAVLQLAVYASLQVPVGVLLDRFGSRRLIATGAVVAAGGQLLMATAHSIGLAVLARALVGAGDAMTFISVLRLLPAWFPPGRVPVLTQVTGIVGQLGQVAAAYPLVTLLHDRGWTFSFTLAAVIGLLAAILAAVVVDDGPRRTVTAAVHTSLADVRAHIAHAWEQVGTRLGFWTHFVTQFSSNVVVLFWGYPFLVVAQGRSPGEAGLLLTVLVVVAMGVGPLLGGLVKRWPRRRSIPTLTIVMATAAAWTVVLAWPGPAPLAILVVLMVVLATNGPGSLVGFDYARTYSSPTHLGSATGIINSAGFIATLLVIALVGVLLDLLSPGGLSSATLGDYRAALSVQYLFWAIGLINVIHARRRLRAVRGIEIDTFPRAVARVARRRRRRRPSS